MIKSKAVERELEAGIKLRGTEVKAIREGRVDWRGAYVRLAGGEAFLQGLKIFSYSKAAGADHEIERFRKLLLKKSEIAALAGFLSRKGTVVFPLKIYGRGKYLKVALGIGRGKKQYEHRHREREKQREREIEEGLSGVTSFA